MPTLSESPYQPDRFLVCGLGSVGQHCVVVLKEYGAIVSAIDQEPPKNWEIQDLPDLLETLLIGDCRLPNILEQAQVSQCRAVLLVTGNERVNTEAALAARSLNPNIRLIVRSDKQTLNGLLRQNLGNFAAFEPTQISASAFALTALGAETLAYFNLEGHSLRVVKHRVQTGDLWCDRWRVHGIDSEIRRVLSHTKPDSELSRQFYEWEPEMIVQAEDTLIYIEAIDQLINRPALQSTTELETRKRWRWRTVAGKLKWKDLKQRAIEFWQTTDRNQTRRVAVICGITVILLWGLGSILYCLYYPGASFTEAFYAPVILLLGGYGDLFGSVRFVTQPETAEKMPGWLRLFSLGLTLAGTAFVGVLYALLTETLLSSKFQFFASRPPIPKQDHVVLVGLGRVGQRVATLLQELKQPVVGISSGAIRPIDQADVTTDPFSQLPVLVGNLINTLRRVNLSHAKSIIVVTDDDMQNLEIGLMAHAANPTGHVVIRAYDQHFRDSVARLFPYAQVLCGSALSAEVFAAAAFGENVLSLFHFNQQIVLVTEYKIEAGDTLNGLLLADIAYGYGVVPILYQRYTQPSQLMPSDETRLYVGDRLVVLATSQSLQRIERGELASRQWQIQINKAASQTAQIEGADHITWITGYSYSAARELMNHLPTTLHRPLYKHQAQHLVRKLNKSKVVAHLVCLADSVIVRSLR